MKELIVTVGITLFLFGLVFYQSFRDKHRWKRISSGMSLFGDRENIPALQLDGKTYEPHERRILIIWGNMEHTAYKTMHDAKIDMGKARESEKAKGARFFAWDGENWKQR